MCDVTYQPAAGAAAVFSCGPRRRRKSCSGCSRTRSVSCRRHSCRSPRSWARPSTASTRSRAVSAPAPARVVRAAAACYVHCLPARTLSRGFFFLVFRKKVRSLVNNWSFFKQCVNLSPPPLSPPPMTREKPLCACAIAVQRHMDHDCSLVSTFSAGIGAD